MPITPLPALDRTSATFKTDTDVFFGSLLPAFSVELESLRAASGASAAQVDAVVILANDDRIAAETAAAEALTRSAAAALSEYNAGLSEIAAEADRVAAATSAALAQTSGSAVALAAHLASASAFDAPLTQPQLVQKKMMEPFFGFGASSGDTQIFSGATNTSQGLAYAVVGGVEKLYIMQSIVAGSLIEAERKRIVEFNLLADGSVGPAVVWSDSLAIGHQCLSAQVQGGQVYLYGQMTTQVGHEGKDAGKGFCKITWRGAATTQADVVNKQVFGWNGSGHRFDRYTGATVAVSTDGKYLIFVCADLAGGVLEDTTNYCFVYDRAALEAAADPLTIDPVYQFQANPPSQERTQYNQGVASDGRLIYILRGYYAPLQHQVVQVFDLTGKLLREVAFDGARGLYGKDGILNHATLGTPISFEPEGLALRGSELLVLVMDNWRTGAPIVTYDGSNWASIASGNLGTPPTSEIHWVKTTKAATDGLWNAATTYGNGTASSRRSKLIYSLRAPVGDAGEQPLNSAITSPVSGASVVSRANAVDVAFTLGNQWQVAGYAENTGKTYNGIIYTGTALRIYDQTAGAINTHYGYLETIAAGGRKITQLRSAPTGLSGGAGINIYPTDDIGSPGKILLTTRNSATSTTWETHLQTDGCLRPGVADTQDIGTQTAYRWRRGFFNTLYVGPAGSSVTFTSGAGAPETFVTGAVGSIYTDSVAGVMYLKKTGTGNTGWKLVTQDA